MLPSRASTLFAAALALAWPTLAGAADICGQLTQRAPRVMRAAFTDDGPDRPPPTVTLTFVGHATFLIESPGGVRIVTDYNDYVRPPVVPDIATMNRAHSTHYSDHPDPGIAHVLRGWDPAGGVARHDVIVGDVRVRNVPTNIRLWGADATLRAGNSIFIFEAGGLCVVHLGHLHHTLDPRQVEAIGKVDVLLVPIDGNYTLDGEGMFEVLEALKAPIMIPMHVFGTWTLERFLARAETRWAVERRDTPVLRLARADLPSSPKVVVLPGR